MPDFVFFFFQAEDGIRDLVRSRGLGDVYKRQPLFERAPDFRNALVQSIAGGNTMVFNRAARDLLRLSLIHI